MTFRLHKDVSKERSLELVLELLEELKKTAIKAYDNSPPDLIMSQPFDFVRVMVQSLEDKLAFRMKKYKIVESDEGKEL